MSSSRAARGLKEGRTEQHYKRNCSSLICAKSPMSTADRSLRCHMILSSAYESSVYLCLLMGGGNCQSLALWPDHATDTLLCSDSHCKQNGSALLVRGQYEFIDQFLTHQPLSTATPASRKLLHYVYKIESVDS